MKKILVPIDFSRTSRNAEEYAASLAKVFGAEVQLLHVYKEILPPTVGPEPWTVTLSETQVENEKAISKEVSYLKKLYPVEVTYALKTGSRGRSINAIAEGIDADLIVMGMRRSRRNKILGSTVLTTIRKTKAPVLIIPDEAKFTAIRNIALAADFTEMVSGSYFDTLFEIYKKFDSFMHVLHVEQPGAELKASEVPEKLQLGMVLSRFTYQYEKIESYDVEEGIQNFVEKHPTDLLVLIAHHHSIYERMFETIHTKSLSFKMNLPLLVVRHP